MLLRIDSVSLPYFLWSDYGVIELTLNCWSCVFYNIKPDSGMRAST